MKVNFKKGENLEKGAVKYIACGEGKKKYDITFSQNKGIKINRQVSDIEIIESEDGFFYLKWKNRKYYAEIIEKNQNKFIIMINGVSYHFSIETPISFKRKKYLEKHQEKDASEPITAPMPGKIVEVLAEENTEVKTGDAVFILEAMKMQNEILAHVSGKVSKINVKENDSVVKGDVLVEIEN